jgi:transaldolase
MEIFIDTAKIAEVKRWLDCGVVDGVTTNPSIMFKDGISDVKGEVKKIAGLIKKKPLSVEVTTDDFDEMLSQARDFAGWADNIVVKIPVLNSEGAATLGVIQALAKQGLRVNATAVLSFNQAVLAAKAGAAYVSIFSGRVADEGHDPFIVIRSTAEWLMRWRYQSKIIVGSIRGAMDAQTAAMAGAHVITVPPQILDKMMAHKYSQSTARDFMEDAKKAFRSKK